MELIAQGNTTIDGRQFMATAERLSYEQDKDLLVLEGSDRTGARFCTATDRASVDPRREKYSTIPARID